jgi:outer membrane protein OmpA-like peptidoglycan-associated protein
LMKMAVVAVLVLTMAACGTVPAKPEGADIVREKLIRLQGDPQLASRASVEIKEAEVAVSLAEQPERDKALAKHRVTMADRMVDIASARAQSRLLVDQREGLSEQRDQARLDARTSEANAAQAAAARARMDASSAKSDATNARRDAAFARDDAARARSDSNAATLRAEELEGQIADLNAKATARGLVVTLGDVLFSTAKSDLNAGGATHLNKLVAFLAQYGDRTLVIEGHTDDVGDSAYNQGLSQRRADAVKDYLIGHGIDRSRLSAYGKGEASPVSSNDSSTGRQLNRRVEVIISNTIASRN